MTSNNDSNRYFPVLVGGAIFVLIFALFAVSFITANNTANALEKSIQASYKSSQVFLAQYGLTVAEATQVPAMARDDAQVLIRAAIEGRYGKDGAKAVFQSIQEQNPTVDPALYTKLLQIIEAGRNQFKIKQDVVIDQKRVYETALGTFWTGRFMGFAGFPKIDLAQYEPVLTNQAVEAFQTKREAPMQLRPAQ